MVAVIAALDTTPPSALGKKEVPIRSFLAPTLRKSALQEGEVIPKGMYWTPRPSEFHAVALKRASHT